MGHRAWGIGHGKNRIRTRITYSRFFNSHCLMPIAHCPLPIAQCPMPNAQHPTANYDQFYRVA
ncbi:hypothetical protein [Tolypothrix sp. VBCCA 56010]|uniref:hypothetical protein n=1 Tax=Tolypothrix sp. VBCCA 56010 TaxID=3137731 RepID=UPI003D7DBDE1